VLSRSGDLKVWLNGECVSAGVAQLIPDETTVSCS
jgi:hypothetical protein